MRLLQLKPQIRQNWTALAVGHHLQGDPAGAVKILASFEDTLKVCHTQDFANGRLLRRGTIRNIRKLYYIAMHCCQNMI